MDLQLAIQYGLLVQNAECVAPSKLDDRTGEDLKIGGVDYKVLTSIYACDLATDSNPQRGDQIVSFGFVAQAPTNDLVIAVRGTEGIAEWVQDGKFLWTPCPILAGSGQSEDGFTCVYKSLRVAVDPGSNSVVDDLNSRVFSHPVPSVTICGHSLGGAIATLLAFDIAVHTRLTNLAVYTYASPRTGDSTFAAMYNHLVPNTYRVANRMDIVPKLPAPPMFEHVLGIQDLNPGLTKVRTDILCEHHLTTYLFLLGELTNRKDFALNPECIPLAMKI
jgi:hypothetical protein